MILYSLFRVVFRALNQLRYDLFRYVGRKPPRRRAMYLLPLPVIAMFIAGHYGSPLLAALTAGMLVGVICARGWFDEALFCGRIFIDDCQHDLLRAQHKVSEPVFDDNDIYGYEGYGLNHVDGRSQPLEKSL